MPKAYVGTFRVDSSSGVQSVTGIVDRAGDSFEPEYILFVNGSSELEVLYSNPTSLTNCVTVNTNFLRTNDAAAAYAAIGDIPQSGGKLVSGGGGTGADAALNSLEPNAVAGGTIYRTASLDDVYDGGFDLDITSASPNFDTDVMFIALAADDGDMLIGEYLDMAGTFSVDDPRGVFNIKAIDEWNTAGSVVTGAGGAGGYGFGWDSPNGGPMAAHILINSTVASDPGDFRYQRTTEYDNSLGGNPVSPTNGCAVTVWGDTDITVAGGISRGYVVSGANIRTTSGTFLQQIAAGTQSIDLNAIDAKAVFLCSVGNVTSSSVDDTWGEMCTAFLDGTRQSSYWFGEDCTTQPLEGAAFISDSSTLRFGQPQGPSTVFTAVAEFVSLTSNGILTLNWSVNDGVPRQIMWFAIGQAPPPPEPPLAPTEFKIRWVRRSPTVQSDGKRIYHRRFELDMQVGQGNADAPNPTVRMRTSDDGGLTWSNTREMPTGAVGQFLAKVRWFQLGQAYRRVYEVSGDDPVFQAITQAFLDIDGGAH